MKIYFKVTEISQKRYAIEKFQADFRDQQQKLHNKHSKMFKKQYRCCAALPLGLVNYKSQYNRFISHTDLPSHIPSNRVILQRVATHLDEKTVSI